VHVVGLGRRAPRCRGVGEYVALEHDDFVEVRRNRAGGEHAAETAAGNDGPAAERFRGFRHDFILWAAFEANPTTRFKKKMSAAL
jgi:hypothetical protein